MVPLKHKTADEVSMAYIKEISKFILQDNGSKFKNEQLKFTYGSQLKWDDALPLATYCYDITHLVDDLESPFYLYWDPLEGRLSNLQNYCRYMGDQPGRLAVQEL